MYTVQLTPLPRLSCSITCTTGHLYEVLQWPTSTANRTTPHAALSYCARVYIRLKLWRRGFTEGVATRAPYPLPSRSATCLLYTLMMAPSHPRIGPSSCVAHHALSF